MENKAKTRKRKGDVPLTDIVVAILIAVIGSSGISTVVVTVLQHRWEKKKTSDKRIDALVAAQQVMMIDRVRYLGATYIREGKISLSDKENITSMYHAYKDLGGNGHLETVMREIEQLDVTG